MSSHTLTYPISKTETATCEVQTNDEGTITHAPGCHDEYHAMLNYCSSIGGQICTVLII